jgi:hypothetical protein
LRSPEDAKVGIAKRHPYLPGIAKRNHSQIVNRHRANYGANAALLLGARDFRVRSGVHEWVEGARF